MRQSAVFRRLVLIYQLVLGFLGCATIVVYILRLPTNWLMFLITVSSLALIPALVASVDSLIDAVRWLLSGMPGMRRMWRMPIRFLVVVILLLLGVAVFVWVAPAIDPMHGRPLFMILAVLALGVSYSILHR